MVMLLSSVTWTNHVLSTRAQDQQTEEPFVILFDQAHGQFFNETLYETALKEITDIFKLHSDRLPPLEIHFNDEDRFSRELLAGVDLLIITNPGTAPLGNITEKEKLALVEWYQQGKGMILLSNPYVTANENLTGKPKLLNSLLDNNYITISGALFTVTDVNGKKYPDTLIDEKHGIDPARQVLKVNLEDRPKDETAVQELLYDVTTVYTWTQSVTVKNKTIQGWPTTVKKLADGSIEVPSGIPTLYGSSVVTETGFRVILGGSSFMFSDLKENTTGNSWIELGNNLQLWINAVLWAGHFNPEEVLSSFQNVLEMPDFVILGSMVLIGIGLAVIGVGYRFVGPNPLEIIGVDEAARRLQKQLGIAREGRQKSVATTDEKKASSTKSATKGKKVTPSGKHGRRRRQLGSPTTRKKKK